MKWKKRTAFNRKQFLGSKRSRTRAMKSMIRRDTENVLNLYKERKELFNTIKKYQVKRGKVTNEGLRMALTELKYDTSNSLSKKEINVLAKEFGIKGKMDKKVLSKSKIFLENKRRRLKQKYKKTHRLTKQMKFFLPDLSFDEDIPIKESIIRNEHINNGSSFREQLESYKLRVKNKKSSPKMFSILNNKKHKQNSEKKHKSGLSLEEKFKKSKIKSENDYTTSKESSFLKRIKNDTERKKKVIGTNSTKKDVSTTSRKTYEDIHGTQRKKREERNINEHLNKDKHTNKDNYEKQEEIPKTNKYRQRYLDKKKEDKERYRIDVDKKKEEYKNRYRIKKRKEIEKKKRDRLYKHEVKKKKDETKKGSKKISHEVENNITMAASYRGKSDREVEITEESLKNSVNKNKKEESKGGNKKNEKYLAKKDKVLKSIRYFMYQLDNLPAPQRKYNALNKKTDLEYLSDSIDE